MTFGIVQTVIIAWVAFIAGFVTAALFSVMRRDKDCRECIQMLKRIYGP